VIQEVIFHMIVINYKTKNLTLLLYIIYQKKFYYNLLLKLIRISYVYNKKYKNKTKQKTQNDKKQYLLLI
jgi:hypothetical protein